MNIPQEGGCQCGAIRYRITGEPMFLGVCHCTECQRQSGSAFGMSLGVGKADWVLLQGTLKTFTRTSESGRPVICAFCPECGTRIYHEPAYVQGVYNVKPGTLDDTRWLAPIAHSWTSSKQPWLTLPEGTPTFQRQPGE